MQTPVEKSVCAPCADLQAGDPPAADLASLEPAEPSASARPSRAKRRVSDGGLEEAFVIVYDGQMEEFEARLAKLNAKAAKYRLEPIEVVSRKPRLFQQITEVDDRGHAFYVSHAIASPDQAKGTLPHVLVRATQIDLRFPIVKLGGWRVIGMMEPLDTGTLLFPFSRDDGDVRLLDPYRMQPIGCDHCHAKRKRSLGFVLQDEATGTVRQVGSSCLREYTGIDPSALLFLARLTGRLLSCEDEDDRFGRGRRSILTHEYLTAVAFCAQVHGFWSVSKARDTGAEPTYLEAVNLDYTLQRDSGMREKFQTLQGACEVQAAKILAWAQDTTAETRDDFARNVRIVLAQDMLDLSERRQLATAAAAWSLYQKAQGPSDKELRVPSTHFGTVGDKLQAPLKLLRTSSYDTTFGLTFLLVFEDAQHRIVVWKTGRPPQQLTEVDSVGKWFSAQFRIKAHSTWKDVLQTEVTHLKFQGWVEPAQETPEASCLTQAA